MDYFVATGPHGLQLAFSLRYSALEHEYRIWLTEQDGTSQSRIIAPHQFTAYKEALMDKGFRIEAHDRDGQDHGVAFMMFPEQRVDVPRTNASRAANERPDGAVRERPNTAGTGRVDAENTARALIQNPDSADRAGSDFSAADFALGFGAAVAGAAIGIGVGVAAGPVVGVGLVAGALIHGVLHRYGEALEAGPSPGAGWRAVQAGVSGLLPFDPVQFGEGSYGFDYVTGNPLSHDEASYKKGSALGGLAVGALGTRGLQWRKLRRQARKQAIKLADSPYGVDTYGLPAGSRLTALGFKRNSRPFWRQMVKEYPFLFSEANKNAIASGAAPKVDRRWLQYNPQHGPYRGDVLVHHHVEQGPYAVGLPEQAHRDFYAYLHPITNPGVLE